MFCSSGYKNTIILLPRVWQKVTTMIVKRINEKNFNVHSLEGFNRVQEVLRVYKFSRGKYTAVDTDYTLDWDSEARRKLAATLLSEDYISFGAFDDHILCGFVVIENRLRGDRCVMADIQVAKEFRRNGIGSALFNIAKTKAGILGATQLYMSVLPVVETVEFFRTMECEPTDAPVNSIAVVEPTNIQMVCTL